MYNHSKLYYYTETEIYCSGVKQFKLGFCIRTTISQSLCELVYVCELEYKYTLLKHVPVMSLFRAENFLIQKQLEDASTDGEKPPPEDFSSAY